MLENEFVSFVVLFIVIISFVSFWPNKSEEDCQEMNRAINQNDEGDMYE